MARRKTFLASAALATALMFNSAAQAQSINAGDRAASASLPFATQAVADFDTPWAIAVLPDGRMLVTEKPGRIFLVTPDGQKIELGNVPEVVASGQNGMLGLSVRALVRVAFDANGRPDEAERWDMGARIRDVAVAPDGAVWIIEDSNPGRLVRLTPAE